MRGSVALNTGSLSSATKRVSWETLDKLCQVRLFAAEDAPLLSGTSLQELYQAKETKFLHAVKPVPESDLPPGFVQFSAKPITFGANANVGGMDLQVVWHCPEKFLYKPAWLVAVGDGSTEVLAEQKRELGASEFVYPPSDDLPPSPGEPQEALAKLEDSVLPEIPLFCIEEEDGMEEGFSAAGTSAPGSSTTGLKIEVDTKSSQTSEKLESVEKPGGCSSTWQAGKPDQETSSSSLADADPNVAAAAAAAYAVLKAKERGSLVDHDLLIKILTNPILIKTLLAANRDLPSRPRDFLRAISEKAEKGFGGGNNFAAGRGTSSAAHSMGSTTFPTPGQLGCKATTVSAAESLQGACEASGNLSRNPFGHHHESARPFLGSNQCYGRTEVLAGQAKQGALRMGPYQGLSLSNRPDVLKDLMHQHGLEKLRNEGTLRGFAEVDMRAPVLGAFSQLGVGNQVPASSHGRNDGFTQGGRYGGGDMSQSRFQKPCLYFNTPKGCRRGASCFYLHDPSPEHAYMEQGRTETFQFQSSKRPKFGVPDKE